MVFFAAAGWGGGDGQNGIEEGEKWNDRGEEMHFEERGEIACVECIVSNLKSISTPELFM